ncbi:MAG: aminoacyl-tRNA hydrolase [Chlamydiae bacterium]|jgi:PTH1 family peptidyl-tRNA hydrolase|nr:aminoacyl-tRNA hydrolase [Chlamydiota bacterium]
MEDRLLICGLGNPGVIYDTTRHNIGHAIIVAFAKDQGWKFKKDPHLKAEIAFGVKDQKEVHLLFPTVFMNNSGLSVERAMEMLQIDVGSILIIADDVYIPFGELRFREKGSPGGHNGVKSVIDHLVTSDFHRLKVGVGAPYMGSLEEFVLGQFTEEEFIHIPKIISGAHAVIDFWIKGDVGKAKEFAATASLKS